MTISNVTASKQYTGDGSTVTFPTVFVFNTSADIKVIETVTATGVETVQALTTNYTVNGGSTGVPVNGNVVAVSAPPSTVTWTLERIVTNTQSEDIPTAGSFDSAQIEKGLDRSAMQSQQHTAQISRAILNPVGDDDTLDMTLPPVTDRASKLLAFSATGLPVVRDLADGGTGTLANVIEDTTPTLGGALDTGGFAVNLSEGTSVNSAATTNIWATNGNTVHVNNSVGITSFGTAPRIGASRWVIFDGAPLLTNSANLSLQGGANIQAAAGDMAYIYADSTTQFDVVFFKKSGVATVVVAPTVYPITLAAEKPTTSGTSIDFTGIPTGVKRITVMLDGVSAGGTANLLLKIGDAGGIEESGYLSAVVVLDSAPATALLTDGFGLMDEVENAKTYSGAITLTLQDAAAFEWVATSMIQDDAAVKVTISTGTKALTAELDRVRLTTTAGGDTFDAGSISILYET